MSVAEAEEGGAAQSSLTANAPAPVLEEESDEEGASGSGRGMVEVFDVKTRSEANIVARAQANQVVVVMGGSLHAGGISCWAQEQSTGVSTPLSLVQCQDTRTSQQPKVAPCVPTKKRTIRRGMRLGFQCSRKRLELTPGLIELPKQRRGRMPVYYTTHTTHNIGFQTRATIACQ